MSRYDSGEAGCLGVNTNSATNQLYNVESIADPLYPRSYLEIAMTKPVPTLKGCDEKD